jgi:hypothetical protein
MSNTTSDHARELFAAAKGDGPSESAREAMWAGIQTTTVGASSLAAMKGAGIASSKLALGIALGATLTVGIAATVFALTRTTNSPRASERVTATAPRTLERPTTKDDAVPPPIVITGHVAVAQNPPTVIAPATPVAVELDSTTAARTSTTTLSEHDRLAREARMVSEARGALHRGEPETALKIVRAARNQQGARLVPEELTVEAMALRAMGDEAGAQRAEADLAGKFPEQALAH